MAKHQKNPERKNLWFRKKLVQKIGDFQIGDSVIPDLPKFNTKSKSQLKDGNNVQYLESIERDHPLFFQKEFDFDIVDPTAHILNDDSIASKSELDGFIRLTCDGVATWINPDLKKNGVFLGDLYSLYKKFPDQISEFINRKQYFRDSSITAFLHAVTGNAVVVYVPDHIKSDGLIKVEVHTPTDKNVIVPVHVMVIIGKFARANLSLEFRSLMGNNGSVILLNQNDFFLQESAELAVFRHQKTNGNTLNLVDDVICQKRYSLNQFLTLDFGGKGVSSKTSIDLDGEGAESNVTGIYRPLQESKFYYDTKQLHGASNTVSDLLYKGVLGKNAYISWKGNIVVQKGTKGTNGYQANNNLIIHESAKVESLPGLEIITDDVKCSHGVTIGNIDKNHMFYLQSRGINIKDAESLIIEGFLLSSLNRLKTRVFDEQISLITNN